MYIAMNRFKIVPGHEQDFENIWTIEAKKVFNLSAKESLQILTNILEIIKEKI